MFFIGVFVFIFVLWLALGGPSRPLSFSGPLLPGPGALGGGSYLSLPKAHGIDGIEVAESRSYGTSRSPSSPKTLKNISSQISQTQKQVDTLKKDVAKTVAFGTPSPYRNKVTISRSVTNPSATNAQLETIWIYVSSNASEPINLSGWTLESQVTGKRASIPLGTEVPVSGIINATQTVTLRPGDRAVISTGRSPIGASFRENKCIGYFAQFQKFTPALPNTCPTPTSELKEFYGSTLVRDPGCSDYVSRIPRCSITLSPPPGLTSTCQNVLTTHLNYNGCVNAHRTDFDFKGTQWRIYLGRDTSMWRATRETIKLFDASGNTVDMVSY
jgi:hypothetical protein